MSNVKVSFTSFRDVTKGKNVHFCKCNVLINLPFVKIHEIFPSGLANIVNKLVHAHSFVLYNLQLPREIFPVF